MATSSPYYRPPQRTDWQSSMERARGPLYRDADPRMVVQPYADPGNALPNIEQRLLVQPEQNAMEVPDIWRVGGQNALTHPLLLELLRQRPDLARHFTQHNQLMTPP